MGRKKVKPFINRKNASTFHLMHRSQRDVAGDVISMFGEDAINDDDNCEIPISQTGMVLWPGSDNNLPETNRAMLLSSKKNKSKTKTIPEEVDDDDDDDEEDGNDDNIDNEAKTTRMNKSNNNSRSTMMKMWREQLEGIGIIEDGDTKPDRFLKPISGMGTFLDARTGRTVDLQRKKMATATTVYTNEQEEEEKQRQQQQQQQYYDDEENKLIMDCAIMEVDRVFESIPLNEYCMDPDVAAALYDDEFWDDSGNLCNTDKYEELNDDFIWMAAQEPSDDDKATTSNDLFDYDEHIRQLLEKARKNPSNAHAVLTSHDQGQHDAAFFSNGKALPNRDDDDDEWDNEEYPDEFDNDDNDFCTQSTSRSQIGTNGGSVPKLSAAEERALCEKFEQTLAEYDEDDDDDDDDNDGYNDYYSPNHGEYEQNNDEKIDEDNFVDDDDIGSQMLSIQGRRSRRALEGDPYVEAALDEYLQEKNDEVYVQGLSKEQKRRTGGSSFTALVDNKLQWGTQWQIKSVGDVQEEQATETVNDVLKEATERLAEPPIKPPPLEDVLFNDGKSYFSERQSNPWDCESILTTYSNLDNRPTTIGGNSGSRSRRTRPSRRVQSSSNNNNTNMSCVYQPITLSAKTGLPIGTLPENTKQTTSMPLVTGQHHDDDDDDDDDNMTTTTTRSALLYKRDRQETAEEKKQRKLLIKQDRIMARIQKKVTKEIYSIEYQNKRSVPMEDISGKTVFRYS